LFGLSIISRFWAPSCDRKREARHPYDDPLSISELCRRPRKASNRREQCIHRPRFAFHQESRARKRVAASYRARASSILENAMSSDSDLKKAVLDELSWEPSVNAAHVGVTAHEGVVTLLTTSSAATWISPRRLSNGWR
jgi:hypothetical protein